MRPIDITRASLSSLLAALILVSFVGCAAKSERDRTIRPFTKASFSFKKHVYDDIRNSISYTEAESMASLDRTLDEVFTDYDHTVEDVNDLRRSSNGLRQQTSDYGRGRTSALYDVDYGDYGNLYE